MAGQLERCEREWHELEGEFQELQDTHRIYRQKLEELTALQTSCSSSISKQKTRLKDLKCTLQRYKRHASRKEAELIQQLGANVKERQNVFFDMEAYLPKKNGLYLNLVLGNVNVTLLSNQAKFAYKDEYEKFKLYLTIILLLGAVACRFVLHYRVTDEVFNFLLVWYYCTLTIRESILISNGSRIKGWWVSHHYVSTFLSGVMLTWPNGLIYQKFRDQFLAFSIFQSCVQFLQYYYQRGCLYRLRALGERNHLDLTVEGFQSWMWRGLTFLLPFLFCGHFWQLYNAITLFELSSHEECREWQVWCLCVCVCVCVLWCVCGACVRIGWGFPEEGWGRLGRIPSSAPPAPCLPCRALQSRARCNWGLGDRGREFGRPGSPSVV
ncbi:transmembrane protein 120B isoform X2 [Monodon monoceros]|uniref:Transmembrane protein 120B n=1 Tax=Monodon monoceros TaxID=40151 RepID=A0A8C6ATF3_MONMO|nr:transmembrane protein 120B isoform X2 [Monodon monoceros]